MNQKRKGEFQEVEYGGYFTFGDLEDCPNTELKNWAERQSWYNPEVHFSFVRINCWDGAYYRIAIIEETATFVRTFNTPDEVESYKDWEKWKIKNLVIYK